MTLSYLQSRKGKLKTHFQAHESFLVFVITLKCATCETDARASPLNPYVVNFDRSENVDSLEVVNRSAKIGKSDF